MVKWWPWKKPPPPPPPPPVVEPPKGGDDDPLWDRPFVYTGRGTIPIPDVIEKSYKYDQETVQIPFIAHLATPRVRHLFAGGLAGAGARILTHPLDRVRTTMLLFPHEPRFANMTTTLRTFVRELGWAVGLFRGLDISLVKIVPEVAVKFAVYEEMKKLLVSIQPESKFDQAATFIDRFAAGGIAGFSSHLFTYPIKVVQTRMANQRPFGSEFNGIIDAFRKIRCETGYLGFYRGFLVSVAGIGPAMGLDFAIYGFLKKVYKGYYHTHGQTSPALVLLACGTIASTIAHIAVYPLVLIRVRMQASDARALMIQTHEKNVITYLYDCYKELGVRKGLYRGLTPSLAKVVPAVSLSFLFYEKITQYIAASHETDEEKNLTSRKRKQRRKISPPPDQPLS